MSFADAFTLFEIILNTHWSFTPIWWENVQFDPPVDANGDFEPYIAVIHRENTGVRLNLGSDNPSYRFTGVFMMQIFTPERSGPALSRQYADILKGIFHCNFVFIDKTDISVAAADNSFNSVTTDFLTYGCIKNTSVLFGGFANAQNNGSFTVASVTQRKIKISGTGLVNEAAGLPIRVHCTKNFIYRNSGVVRPSVAGVYVPGTPIGGWYQTHVTVPYTRDANV